MRDDTSLAARRPSLLRTGVALPSRPSPHRGAGPASHRASGLLSILPDDPVTQPAYAAPARAYQPSSDRDAAQDLGLSGIVGASEPLREAMELTRLVAGSRTTTVLLVGETGTGKELFARGVHYGGPAAAEPFVAVNCAAIPESLLESELFGHEKGAFTGALAQKKGLMELAGTGTLFLDEVHQMPHSLQPKLLRVLEDRKLRRVGGLAELPIACRIVAGTNVSLEGAVARGEFREDLFYRLNVFRVPLPPLRERPEDIAELARHFLEGYAREHARPPRTLTREALAALEAHRWPGNVRELKNVIERAVILCGVGPAIRPEHLMIQQRSTRPNLAAGDGLTIAVPPGGRPLREIEHEAVRLTMQIAHGNQSEAARILGISRPTLARKLRELSLGGDGTPPSDGPVA